MAKWCPKCQKWRSAVTRSKDFTMWERPKMFWKKYLSTILRMYDYACKVCKTPCEEHPEARARASRNWGKRPHGGGVTVTLASREG